MKIVIVLNEKKSHWFSCQIILNNLIECYRLLGGYDNFKIIYLKSNYGILDYYKPSKEIADLKPQFLIFLDHRPNFAPIIQLLSKMLPTSSFPKIFFHIYGDFMWFTKYWEEMEEHLEGKQVSFLCASERQQKIIRKFLPKKMI